MPELAMIFYNSASEKSLPGIIKGGDSRGVDSHNLCARSCACAKRNAPSLLQVQVFCHSKNKEKAFDTHA